MSSQKSDKSESKEYDKLIENLNSLSQVLKNVRDAEEGSPVEALRKFTEYFTKSAPFRERISSGNFKTKDQKMLKQIGKQIFRGVVQEYDERLRKCEMGATRQEMGEGGTLRSKRWTAFEYNKIPLKKDYFVFVMLMLNAYLQSPAVSSQVGTGICIAINDFFKQYTTYAEQYLPKNKEMLSDDPFKRRSGYFKSFQDAVDADDIEIPEVNYQTEIIEQMTRVIDDILLVLNDDMDKIKDKLNVTIGTPHAIRDLTYDRIETLMLYDAKMEHSPTGGFRSKPNVNEEQLDEEAQQIRKNINYLMTSNDPGVSEKRKEFIDLRQQYLQILEEKKHYVVAIAQKWETMWEQYRQSSDEDKRAQYCIHLKKLIEAYSNLVQSVYVHGRLQHAFPEIEIDVRAYEAFLGHKLKPEHIRSYSKIPATYRSVVYGKVLPTEKLQHKDLMRQLSKFKKTLRDMPIDSKLTESKKQEYLKKIESKEKQITESHEKFKEKRINCDVPSEEYNKFCIEKQDFLKTEQGNITIKLIGQFYKDIGQVEPKEFIKKEKETRETEIQKRVEEQTESEKLRMLEKEKEYKQKLETVEQKVNELQTKVEQANKEKLEKTTQLKEAKEALESYKKENVKPKGEVVETLTTNVDKAKKESNEALETVENLKRQLAIVQESKEKVEKKCLKCKKILDTQKITNLKEYRKWTLGNHPDKFKLKTEEERQKATNLFTDVGDCVDIYFEKEKC